MDLDRIRGGFLGLALGDALGAPHESRRGIPLHEYTGQLQYPIRWQNRFHGTGASVIGQVTDDTTMAAALLNSIVRNRDWLEEDVIRSYLEWANSTKGVTQFMGKNTRALFQGVKTIKGYRTRYSRLDLSSVQSNGSLMRAFPLVLLFYYQPERVYQLALADTSLTNPNPVNQDATLIYLTALKMILQGVPVSSGMPELIQLAQTEPVREALIQAAEGTSRDLTPNKGWVIHAVYVLAQAWLQADLQKRSFPEIMRWIILQGGDTDTNGAIGGSLLGLYYGEKKMLEDPVTRKNIEILLSAETEKGSAPLLPEYHPAAVMRMLQ